MSIQVLYPSDCLCVVGFCLFCYWVVWVSYIFWILSPCQIYWFNSVAQLCLTLCDPKDCSTPGFPVIPDREWHFLRELLSLLKLMSIKSVMPSNNLILCHPLFLLTAVFPSIRVFSNESVLCLRWPKYWSFSFSISPFLPFPRLPFHLLDCSFHCAEVF